MNSFRNNNICHGLDCARIKTSYRLVLLQEGNIRISATVFSKLKSFYFKKLKSNFCEEKNKDIVAKYLQCHTISQSYILHKSCLTEFSAVYTIHSTFGHTTFNELMPQATFKMMITKKNCDNFREVNLTNG